MLDAWDALFPPFPEGIFLTTTRYALLPYLRFFLMAHFVINHMKSIGLTSLYA
jgi:hypothetical protein